jgi:hypothetical protein
MEVPTSFTNAFRTACVCLILSSPFCTATDAVPTHPKAYALSTWKNMTCRAKGRFQDRGYCTSAVMDQIVADRKSAIPVLISQITDSRWIAEPVYDFWPQMRTGELAHFILGDLFVDDTWKKSTMPALFPEQHCDDPSWVCWARFRKVHSLKDIQAHWIEFWKANKERIYWDDKARCFRLNDRKSRNSSPGYGGWPTFALLQRWGPIITKPRLTGLRCI